MTAFTTPVLLRRGDHLTRWLDRSTPPRLQHLLAIQLVWWERLRGSGAQGLPLRRALQSVALDGVALLVLAVTLLATRTQTEIWVGQLTGLPDGWVQLLLDLVGLGTAVPLIFGMLRNAREIARRSARFVASDQVSTADTSNSTIRVLESVASLLLVAGIGLPALAVLRPMVRGAWGEPLVILGFAVALFAVWRNLGAMEGEFRTGVEVLARQLAQQVGTEEQRIQNAALPPGLDGVLALPLPDSTFAVGQTLAALDLRVRTGATVVAIHKPNAQVALPTGHERLEAGDILALSGSSGAVDRARCLLLQGLEASPTNRT